jgi:hypothetical protein
MATRAAKRSFLSNQKRITQDPPPDAVTDTMPNRIFSILEYDGRDGEEMWWEGAQERHRQDHESACCTAASNMHDSQALVSVLAQQSLLDPSS